MENQFLLGSAPTLEERFVNDSSHFLSGTGCGFKSYILLKNALKCSESSPFSLWVLKEFFSVLSFVFRPQMFEQKVEESSIMSG